MPPTAEPGITRYAYDVVVIGAGGAGLRAAIAAREQGKRTAVISKSLFGKAHTVMAEGGAAAALGNANPDDGWRVHFRDTVRGGKFLNDPRMAELHAREAPERILELEYWGALFDRTAEGKISQRNFGGHEYPRLAHVGDRTGLEMIRTLQQRVVALQQQDAAELGDPEARIRVFAETAITRLITEDDAAVRPDGGAGGATAVDAGAGGNTGADPAGGGRTPGRIVGAFGYRRVDGGFVLFEAPSVVLATGGIGKAFRTTSNSWEYTGDGHALALRAGASLINMEFVQFHPTGMVWPPSVKGILVTESVRGDGGVLRNSEGRRFMFDYVPDVFRSQYAESEEEADGWYDDPAGHRRPPELLPRDEVARAINTEVKEGRGSPHGGVFLDVSTRLPAEEIVKRLPSMHHQFKELADVDITAEPMEVGPTCHYVMGGVRVDADTAASDVPGLFAAGEVAGGMHGSNRLGGNSLSDLLVFGRRAGLGAAAYVDGLGDRPAPAGLLDRAADEASSYALRFLRAEGGENPYTLHAELQETMNDLVGIIRRGPEMERALERLEELAERSRALSAPGDRVYNPGWHLALALPNMVLVSRAVAAAALERTESRGGHTREDFPGMSAEWRRVNLAVRADRSDRVSLSRLALADIPAGLLALFERDELAKYLTEEELPASGAADGAAEEGQS
ncbi:fumarate reductase/succinate dehydrogenase flavoprotein subunit [Nocardiopsis dassonvillei]|uniref:Fumarate reductase/succinate dehydrogenase flavoprotein domain protein n=1 Tax=Nocardiopsis dassonvillei (strain ATCC 23218 / DSM 43111 / CIP 107115 / JCM 7437 / KCTC 9190 / NBRC 14626 / NCTC 10488 / NRRL B-5397 / IMRU 509) TaxID=446468 RepID=D7B6N6_NOCDD|nr:fumarate reductase/succinate dehydrogenase flavoprotein subunit [Nocardiopsis dassonvillei]ADH69323.1 fumarate reductase/succinate dehydrogenase flavoprotein domain protein [Nocardiopsis dassonvillei subsp. dassonvillei DSM 43111]APC37345.1 fumarate reductase/succinate dehydrogenase flavoprotein subunit [Nocardiopsis dassonvillei]NKY81072.1 fumarate reductase/succinate dehydrogenase flavoprotein subunit [Nocardiopsis dassonvillei]VEI89833.1 Succinate dehydrogenase flavoprotein subunit [Nocar